MPPRCACCFAELMDGEELCRHHVADWTSDQAASNRVLSDFFHRRVPLPRVAAEEREKVRGPDGEIACDA